MNTVANYVNSVAARFITFMHLERWQLKKFQNFDQLFLTESAVCILTSCFGFSLNAVLFKKKL